MIVFSAIVANNTLLSGELNQAINFVIALAVFFFVFCNDKESKETADFEREF